MTRLMLVAALLALTACTAEELGNGAFASAKSWCRSGQPNCSVQDGR